MCICGLYFLNREIISGVCRSWNLNPYPHPFVLSPALCRLEGRKPSVLQENRDRGQEGKDPHSQAWSFVSLAGSCCGYYRRVSSVSHLAGEETGAERYNNFTQPANGKVGAQASISLILRHAHFIFPHPVNVPFLPHSPV